MTKQTDLVAFLFEGQPHPLSETLLRWMEASPRFTVFTHTYRDKIRKKIRGAREPKGILDLRCELEIAYSLLTDRRLEVGYEPYASARRRSPDFAITYRANLVFNIEVARMRVDEGEMQFDLRRTEVHILRILFDKLGQMQPGMANLLVIYTHQELARTIDLDRLMQKLKTRVERKDPSFYGSSRYTSPVDFYKEFLHLTGILLWAAGAQVWVNKQARPGLPEKVLRLVSLLPSRASEALSNSVNHKS